MMDGFSGLRDRNRASGVKRVRFLAVSSVLLVAASLSMAVGTAWAGSGISLCVPKKEGAALLTPKHGLCKRGYTLTALGQTGAEGKPGAAGTPGAPGKAGAEGKGGAEGKAGAEGKEGKTGPEGGSGFSAAQAEQLKSLLPYIKFIPTGVGGKPTVQFFGVNVQVVNGETKTTTTNGLGNLVIGYDENAGKHAQTGSHDLILGTEQTFTSYAGIATGTTNTIAGPFSTVTGGGFNQALGIESSVSGGWKNVASNERSTVAGGGENQATGVEATVGGGWKNIASGEDSIVSGGRENHAATFYSSVSGGKANTASGEFSSVTGGKGNTASGESASVLGGESNLASGKFASIFGSKLLTAMTSYEAIP